MKCDGCKSECTQCNSSNNALCLSCTLGLALFNNTCVVNCPEEYLKSKDGTTCELRPYLLDSSLVYFPFAIAAVALLTISFLSGFVTCFKSLVLTNSIAFLSIVEIASLVMIFFLALKRKYVLIYYGAAGILGLQIALNISFIIYYLIRLQYKDISFVYWRQKYVMTTVAVLVISACVNFKFFRILYCRFFKLDFFSATIQDSKTFFKPIVVFSMIHLFTFTAPVLGLGFIILY